MGEHMSFRKIVVAALAFAFSSCGEITGDQSGYVSASFLSEGIAVSNGTSSTLYYFLIERGAAASTDWVACVDPITCQKFPGIRP
jgi:hypothetical protein